MTAEETGQKDPRIKLYQLAVEKMLSGGYDAEFPVQILDDTGCLGQALNELASQLAKRSLEHERLMHINSSINAGLMLEDILENVYRDFRKIIPYNRIGLALLEKGGQTVRAVWGKSDQPVMRIDRGYSAPLAGSSLEKIINTGHPRIINDLLIYLKNRPQSESTRMIVAEGLRSSLTCPLTANGTPIGFLFFSSTQPNIYAEAHIEVFKQIAGSLSISVEKGRLVSELAASKAAIEAQNEELRRLNEIKNNFLGIAAHDLRSPLSQIQLATGLLLHPEPWLDEEERSSLLRSFLSSIEQSTRQMLNQLNDLLDVSEVDSGKLTLKFDTIEMKQLLEDAASHHGALAANKGIQIILSEVPDEKVVADPIRLRQVLDNLISNALNYSPPGSSVRLSCQLKGSQWQVSVEDEGPGFHAEDQEFLFQELSRHSAEAASDEKSAGLGLAIARRVIEAHGGQIGVESEPGKGACFWFRLPY
jgi:signal transduction histidine kinase